MWGGQQVALLADERHESRKAPRLTFDVDMAVDMSRGKKGARVSFSRLVTTK